MQSNSPSLLGRDQELEALDSAIAAARQGRGSSVLVSGEPGIGKSALARAFAERAAAGGLVVAWGRAWEASGAPPFWPWIEVLRAVLRARGAEPLPDIPNLAALIGLVPEIAQRAPDLVPLPSLEPATMRFQIGEAVAAFLFRAAHDAPSSPLAIILEDLHAADRATLEALRFVASRLAAAPLALVGTYRPADARLAAQTHELIERAARDAGRMTLARLDRAAVSALVARSPAALDEREAADLTARTEGNPLFIIETLRLWQARRALGLPLPADALADGVRDVIRQRLALLPPETRRVLELGAAQGRVVEPRWLALAAGVSEVAVRELLRPALAADIVAERDAEHVAFTHVLLRDALYGDLPETRRAELHLALGEALERRTGADSRTRATGLAHHFLEAASVDGLERALGYACAAAERAVELHAHEEAIALLRRALTAIDGAGSTPTVMIDPRVMRCDVLLALGLAHMRAQQADEGKLVSLEAAALARACGDPERLARAALVLGAHLTFGHVDPDLVSALEEALVAIGRGETPLRARLLARLAAATQPADDPTGPIAMAREALALARRVGDGATRLEVMTAAGSALSYFAEPSERIELANELAQTAKSLGDKVRLARALVRLAVDHMELGQLAAADARIAEHAVVAGELRLGTFTWMVPLLAATRAIHDGRFAEAERHIEAARSMPGRPVHAAARLTLAGVRAGLDLVATRWDDFARSGPDFAEQCDQIADRWYPLAAHAAVAALSGDAPDVERRLADVRPHIVSWRHRLSTAWLAEAALAARDLPLAAELVALMTPLAHRWHLWGTAALVCDGPMAEPLGRLASLLGRHDEAVSRLDDALLRARAVGARPHAARIGLRLATALEARAGPGDRERAQDLRRAVCAEARALGMPGLIVAASAPETDLAPPAMPEVERGPGFSLVREGEVWTVTHGARRVRLKDTRGLRILEQLLARPGRDIHVLELLGATEAGDAGEALDATAIKAYRGRAADLRDELAEAREWGDLGRAERLQAELEAIAAQLAHGVGLGDRARKEASAVERARVNVRRRLVDTLERIAVELPELARHLERGLKTGVVCTYRAD